MSKPAEPSLGRLIVLIASSVVVVAGIKAAAVLVVPFLCAVFLAVLSLPLLRWLGRIGLPGSLARGTAAPPVLSGVWRNEPHDLVKPAAQPGVSH